MEECAAGLSEGKRRTSRVFLLDGCIYEQMKRHSTCVGDYLASKCKRSYLPPTRLTWSISSEASADTEIVNRTGRT